VYRDSFMLFIPEFLSIDEKIIDGCVGGQLMSSLLAVSCITVAFCSNMLMIQDKVNGAANDIAVSPVKSSHVALSYYVATFAATFIICAVALGACMIYLALTAWYLTAADILFLLLDIFIMVMFGTAISSVIGFFLNSQGAISAVGSIVSSCYGFICGAYMPISQFGEGLQNALSFFPGTYGTALFRNHSMRSALSALEDAGLPSSAVEEIRNGIDCNIYFFDKSVPISTMFLIVGITVAVSVLAYIVLNVAKGGKAKKA
jgi:multidrug/hemolysin transport system permease protein